MEAYSMDKETYIITDHELYRKVDWNAYELYFLQSAKEKIRTDISPNIINATRKCSSDETENFKYAFA